MEGKELREYLHSLPRLADKDRDKRIKKARSDFWFFIKTYFPHHIEHATKETSHFRRTIHKEIEGWAARHKTIELTAYRGAAKSTTITNLYTLWEIAKKTRHYILLISATEDLSLQMIELILTELDDNANFKSDFELSVQSMTKSESVIVTAQHLTKIKGAGAGSKIRGARFMAWRPDLIILDDIENDENVESKAQREKLYRWYTRAIKRLPSLHGHYNIIIVGTILHHDSLLSRLKDKVDLYRNFNLVLDFDTFRLDDSSLDKKAIKAEYEEDQAAFLQERQNQPISPDMLPFGNYQTFETVPSGSVCYMAVDPSLGKKRGDWFAIGIIHKKDQEYFGTGFGFKLSPDKMIDRIIEYYKIWRPLKLGVETVAFQEFFKDVLKSRARASGIVLPIVEIKHRAPKELRIDSLSPYVEDGTLKVNAKSYLLIDEMLTWPKSSTDDLLDAQEMAFSIARGGSFSHAEAAKNLRAHNRKDNLIKRMLHG